ncbi:MAG: hypothetical protein IJ709_08150 [Selenomonas sp.]|nr:hypothetical protein [Selenomonas sp.]
MNNLYKIRLGLLLAKIRLNGIYTRDTFREEDHPRDEAGKFTKSVSTTAGSRAKINVSPTGANKFVKRGFASKQKLMNHWKNGRIHAGEFPEIKTAQEYERRALELIEMPVGGDILGHVDKDGVITRYNKKTHEFVKGHPTKGIRTFMKPRLKDEYYELMLRKDLENGGKC